jgi:hypothetical protein
LLEGEEGEKESEKGRRTPIPTNTFVFFFFFFSLYAASALSARKPAAMLPLVLLVLGAGSACAWDVARTPPMGFK